MPARRRIGFEMIHTGKPDPEKRRVVDFADGIDDMPQTAEQRKRLAELRLRRAQWLKAQTKK